MQVSSFGFGISSPFTEAAFLKEERQRLIRAVVLGPVPKVRPAGQVVGVPRMTATGPTRPVLSVGAAYG